MTRQLYGRLQKHKRHSSSFSNKQSKRTLTKTRYSDVQDACGSRGRKDKEVLKSEDVRRYEQTCINAIKRIAHVACQMQDKIANTFWIRCTRSQIKTETDELRSEGVSDQWKSGRNNVQLTEIVDTHSTDACVDTVAAEEMPAVWVSSVRSARCGRTPFTSFQFSNKLTSNTGFDNARGVS